MSSSNPITQSWQQLVSQTGKVISSAANVSNQLLDRSQTESQGGSTMNSQLLVPYYTTQDQNLVVPSAAPLSRSVAETRLGLVAGSLPSGSFMASSPPARSFSLPKASALPVSSQQFPMAQASASYQNKTQESGTKPLQFPMAQASTLPLASQQFLMAGSSVQDKFQERGTDPIQFSTRSPIMPSKFPLVQVSNSYQDKTQERGTGPLQFPMAQASGSLFGTDQQASYQKGNQYMINAAQFDQKDTAITPIYLGQPSSRVGSQQALSVQGGLPRLPSNTFGNSPATNLPSPRSLGRGYLNDDDIRKIAFALGLNNQGDRADLIQAIRQRINA